MTAVSIDDLFEQDWLRIMQLDPADPRVAEPERPCDDCDDLGDEDLASVPPEVAEDFLSDPYTGEGETFAAGFLHHEGGRRGTGFAAGGILDQMDAGPLLAQLVHAFVTDPGRLAGMGESALIGLLYSAERLGSWTAALRGEVITALGVRRAVQSAELENQHLLEHVDGELAAALHITRRSATRILDHCGLLRRLPAVRAAQLRGRITWEKGEIFGDELAVVTDEQAQEIAARVLPEAEGMTPEELRRLLRRLVAQADPGAARERRKKARKDTGVHLWTEPSGNCGLAGRELDPALARAADARLTAQALWLAGHGMEGTLGKLRAAAFLANQNGIPLASLLPKADDSAEPDGTAHATGGSNAGDAGATSGAAQPDSTNPDATSRGTAPGGKPRPATPADAPGAGSPAAGPDRTGSDAHPRGTGSGSTTRDSTTRDSTTPGSTTRDSTTPGSKPGPAHSGAAGPGDSDSQQPGDDPLADSVPITEVPAGPAVTGIINLTMPLSAHAHLTDRPGEIAGSGPADADTCRTLAEWMARDPATKWCLTLVDPDGRAVAHACAKDAPPTPGTPPTPEPLFTPGTPPTQGTPPAPDDWPTSGPPPTPKAPPTPKTPRTRDTTPTQDEPPRPGDPPTSPGRAGPPGPDTPTPAQSADASWAADLAGRLTDWLARLRLEFLEAAPCTHQRETLAYRPTRRLRHLITVRNRTCTEPGCTRPAQTCDLDHTLAYAQGGRTCECDLGPLCRHGHQAKQAPGWHLEQPEPGVMIWTLPSGRQHTTRPDAYPT
jgi:hypothetical protein